MDLQDLCLSCECQYAKKRAAGNRVHAEKVHNVGGGRGINFISTSRSRNDRSYGEIRQWVMVIFVQMWGKNHRFGQKPTSFRPNVG